MVVPASLPEPGLGNRPATPPVAHPLLGHEGRARLLDLIKSNVGVCETELSARAGISRNTAKYHLKRLLRAGLITKRREGRHVHFFPRGMGFLELQRAVANTRGETRCQILRLIHDRPDLSWRAVGRRLDITARAVRWHLEKLEDAKLIDVDRGSIRRKVRISPVLEAVLQGDPARLSRDVVTGLRRQESREASDADSAAAPTQTGSSFFRPP